MKNILTPLAVLVLLTSVACHKKEPEPPTPKAADVPAAQAAPSAGAAMAGGAANSTTMPSTTPPPTDCSQETDPKLKDDCEKAKAAKPSASP